MNNQKRHIRLNDRRCQIVLLLTIVKLKSTHTHACLRHTRTYSHQFFFAVRSVETFIFQAVLIEIETDISLLSVSVDRPKIAEQNIEKEQEKREKIAAREKPTQFLIQTSSTPPPDTDECGKVFSMCVCVQKLSRVRMRVRS